MVRLYGAAKRRVPLYSVGTRLRQRERESQIDSVSNLPPPPPTPHPPPPTPSPAIHRYLPLLPRPHPARIEKLDRLDIVYRLTVDYRLTDGQADKQTNRKLERRSRPCKNDEIAILGENEIWADFHTLTSLVTSFACISS